jgi:hypothetical protein
MHISSKQPKAPAQPRREEIEAAANAILRLIQLSPLSTKDQAENSESHGKFIAHFENASSRYNLPLRGSHVLLEGTAPTYCDGFTTRFAPRFDAIRDSHAYTLATCLAYLINRTLERSRSTVAPIGETALSALLDLFEDVHLGKLPKVQSKGLLSTCVQLRKIGLDVPLIRVGAELLCDFEDALGESARKRDLFFRENLGRALAQPLIQRSQWKTLATITAKHSVNLDSLFAEPAKIQCVSGNSAQNSGSDPSSFGVRSSRTLAEAQRLISRAIVEYRIQGSILSTAAETIERYLAQRHPLCLEELANLVALQTGALDYTLVGDDPTAIRIPEHGVFKLQSLATPTKDKGVYTLVRIRSAQGPLQERKSFDELRAIASRWKAFGEMLCNSKTPRTEREALLPFNCQQDSCQTIGSQMIRHAAIVVRDISPTSRRAMEPLLLKYPAPLGQLAKIGQILSHPERVKSLLKAGLVSRGDCIPQKQLCPKWDHVRAGRAEAKISSEHSKLYALLAEKARSQTKALEEILSAFKSRHGIVNWAEDFIIGSAQSSITLSRLRLLLDTGGHQPTDVDADGFAMATGASFSLAQELLTRYPALSRPTSKERRCISNIRKELLQVLQPRDVAELHEEQGLYQGADPRLPDFLYSDSINVGQPPERYPEAGVPKYLRPYSGGEDDFSTHKAAQRDATTILRSISRALQCESQITEFFNSQKPSAERHILNACLSAWRTRNLGGALQLVASQKADFCDLCPHAQAKILDSMSGGGLGARFLEYRAPLAAFRSLFLSVSVNQRRELGSRISVSTELVSRGLHTLRALFAGSPHLNQLLEEAQDLPFRPRCEVLSKIGGASPLSLDRIDCRSFLRLASVRNERFANQEAARFAQNFVTRLVSDRAELIGTADHTNAEEVKDLYSTFKRPIHERLEAIAQSPTARDSCSFVRALHTMRKIPEIHRFAAGRSLCARGRAILEEIPSESALSGGFNAGLIEWLICEALADSKNQANLLAVARFLRQVPPVVGTTSLHLHNTFFNIFDRLPPEEQQATLLHCWNVGIESTQPIQRAWLGFLQHKDVKHLISVVVPDSNALIKLLGCSFAEPSMQKVVLDSIDSDQIVKALEQVRDRDPSALGASLQHERVEEGLELLTGRCQLLVRGRAEYEQTREQYGDHLRHKVFSTNALPNHFAILGVPVNATPETIQESLTAIRSCFHPDTVNDDTLKAAYTAIVQEATRSADVLKQPETRKAYLAKLGFHRHHKSTYEAYAPQSPWFGRLMADDLWKRKIQPGSLRSRPGASTQVLQLASSAQEE